MVNTPNSNRLFLSFGENCLTYDILKRYSLNTYSTPFSSARSNIEYILFLEKNRYTGFLDYDNLAYEDCCGTQVVRLKIGRELINHYDPSHMRGFEFTHHDVIENDTHRDAFYRRYNRLLNLKDESLTIFYHHRICKQTDWTILLNHLSELRSIYLNRGLKSVDIVVFTQSIVSDEKQRKMNHYYSNHIHIYVFQTMNVWGGTNQDIFWARVDDDLLRIMINEVRQGL